ncbi:hypothetical protein K1719_015495 [Acacia pycnantha]|nr:hypothetical protein K1719_015495 [Acacia pycnantha]
MLVAIMRAYDPPTNQFRIRGKTLEIQGEDMAQLLGVPRSGEEVRMNVSDTDPILLQLRKDYGKMKYDDILNVITSGESGDQFEILFMMHMLGTFLTPTSSTTPSMQLLKVLTSTMKGFAHFDWATYIANDIRTELSDYVNAKRQNKDCNSYVRGCIYMLLVLKDLYANLMGIINDGHKRLVASVEDKLRKAQTHIERKWKQQVGEEDDGDDSQDGHADDEAQEGDSDGHHDYDGDEAGYEDEAYQDDASIGTPINIDESDGGKSYCKRRILIQIDDEDITREQLKTLGRRNRLSNRNLLNRKPVGWKVSEWKQQLLPEYIGYNMCDYDLIMAPMLVVGHWFCMALDPSTMNFYVLDSMKTKVYISKNQASKKKKTAGASPQAKAIAKIVSIVSYLYYD